MDVRKDAIAVRTARAVLIVITPQTHIVRKDRLVQSAYLLSTVPGRHGREELVDFAKGLSMPAQWLRQPRTVWEHFECVGGRIERAQTAGAIQVDSVRLQTIVHRKRELTGEIPSERVRKLRRVLAIRTARQTELRL